MRQGGNVISDGSGKGIGGAAPQSSFIGGQQWAMNGQGWAVGGGAAAFTGVATHQCCSALPSSMSLAPAFVCLMLTIRARNFSPNFPSDLNLNLMSGSQITLL